MNIVCIAFPAWRGNYVKSTVKLMEELALNNKVLYVNYGFTIKDLLGKDNEQNIDKLRIIGLKNPVERIKLQNGAYLYLLSLPALLPFNFTSTQGLYNAIQRINKWLVLRRLNKVLTGLDMKTYTLVNAFNPFMGALLHKNLKPQKSIYYCYDNIGAAPWAQKHGLRLQSAYINMVDELVFTSRALAETFGPKNKTTHVVNNGVDLSHFMVDRPTQINPQPVVGYVGSIDDRLNYELLTQLANNNKNCNFVFVGRKSSAQFEQLMMLSNVKYLGMAAPKDLPAIIKGFNVAIIPFLSTPFTKFIYPMKVNEYLICGIPVVSTTFAHLPEMNEQVYFASNSQDFDHKLSLALANDNAQLQSERQAFAQQNSWKNKAQQFEKILQHA